MFHHLRLGPISIDQSRVLPPIVQPLVDAAKKGFELVSEIEAVTRHFRFDSFMYGVTLSSVPDNDGIIYTFTTLPIDWVLRYQEMAYIEVDPRISDCWDRTVPLVWDQSTMRSKGAKVDAFLDDALAHGVGSGVCLPLHDEAGARILVVFNSRSPLLTKHRQLQIAGDLGEMIVFANYFHELFAREVIAKGIPPRSAGMRLSPRERECLILAAQGMTTEAIGKKLGIAGRTAQFHFDSIKSKLMARNRQEAVARAMKEGQIVL
jgi:DNA-binding CsgD family transcriptional regulator